MKKFTFCPIELMLTLTIVVFFFFMLVGCYYAGLWSLIIIVPVYSLILTVIMKEVLAYQEKEKVYSNYKQRLLVA